LVTDNIVKILTKRKVQYEIFEHEPVYTSEHASRVRGVDIKTGVKALVMKTHDGRFILVLVRADKRADTDRIAELEKTKKVRLADPKDVLMVTGCEVGAVPPFGHLTKLKTYFDREILENDYVNFSCGEHTKSIRMKAEDLKKIINPDKLI